MSDRSVLHELSRSLSEKERQELLKKIDRSVNLADSSESNIYPKKMSDDERYVLLDHDLQNSSLFTRFLIWLKSVFSGKNPRDLFMAMRIASLKAKIQKANHGLTGFETRDLKPKLAEEFFKLYVLVNSVRPLFKGLWRDTKHFEEALIMLLEKRIPDAKKDVYELVPQDEMEKVYEKTNMKEKIRNLVDKRIDTFVNSIPQDVFTYLEDQIKPIYYLKDVVLFPYSDFFQLFHFTPQPTDEQPYFKSTSAYLALEYLERMFFAVYTALKIKEPIEVDKDFANQLAGVVEQYGDIEEENPDQEDEEEGIEESLRRDPATHLVRILQKVLKGVKQFNRNVPLVELIRYFKKDPYYQLIFYIPKLYLREFYHSLLKIRFLPQFDERFPQIRENVINKKIDELFGGRHLSGFLYYRNYNSLDTQDLGLPTFSYTRSVLLLYNYIRYYYRTYIQETIQIVSRGILQQNRITLNRLLLHAASVEDLEDKLRELDNSLSPDEEDGKLFQRIRHSLASESTHQRLFRNLITQKDKEAETLLEKGKESFLGIKKIFDELLDTTMESILQKLNTSYVVGGKSITLKNLLDQQARHIEEFRRLLHQLSKIERGS